MDGYNPSKRTIYEFHGCVWHGCSKCYLPDTLNPVNETSLGDLLEGTVRKIEYFRKLGYTVQVLWECEFHQQLATNPEMKDFVRNLNLDTPLEPRHKRRFPVQGSCWWWENSLCGFYFPVPMDQQVLWSSSRPSWNPNKRSSGEPLSRWFLRYDQVWDPPALFPVPPSPSLSR